MEIDPETLTSRERYSLLVSSVVPRPIGWVSTLSSNHEANLAPFSFFNAVNSNPWMVMFSSGQRKGKCKDTAKNLLETKEAVIHLPTKSLASKMVETSADVESGVDEFELVGLTKIPSRRVSPYRIKEAPLAMEGRLSHHLELGDRPTDFFILEILLFHIQDDLLKEGLVDFEKLQACARLGGSSYIVAENPFEIERPSS